MALGRVCTSVALVSLLTLSPTLSAGYCDASSAALPGLAQLVVRQCGRTCSCDGAVGAPQSNACAVPHVSAGASLAVQRSCSQSPSTYTAADAIGDGASACIPSAPLPIRATDHQWALLGESLADVLGPEPVRLLLGRYCRRRHGRARSGQDESFGEPDAAEGLGLTAAWACVSVVSGVGLLVAGRHFSWLVCLALSLNYWCAAAWITKGMSLHVGLAFLAFAVVQRRSLWLFGEQGNCALASLLSARSLLVSASCSPVRGVCARTATAALPLFTPPPLHLAAEKRKRVSPELGRQSPPKDRRTGAATEVCDAL